MQRREVHFSGYVQGVGFRYTVHRLADELPISGYVENLADGRVRLVVEGSTEHVELLVTQVHERMADYIKHVTSETHPATGTEQGFFIRY